MGKVMDAITEKMSAEAAKEFKAAIDDLGFYLLDNSKSEYVNRGKADAELATAKKSLEDLTAKMEALQADAAKGGETTAALEKKLKEAMDAHKAEVSELKAGADRDKKSAEVKKALAKAGAYDPDDAYVVAGFDLDKIDYDSKGNLVGLSDRIKALQESKTYLFDEEKVDNTNIPSKGTTGKNPWKNDSFNLTEQGRLLRDDPAKARSLAAEAGITLPN